MKTEKTTPSELTGNSHIKEFTGTIGLVTFATVVTLAIVITHLGITYIDYLFKGVH